jgi:putative transcriptional regulator
MDSLAGTFLIASPHLPDPNFYRSVVLIIQHNEEGAFGVVLNRPTDKTASEIWELFSDEPCSYTQPIYLGGPVAGPLLALHDDVSASEVEVLEGVYLSTDRAKLESLVRRDAVPLRLFVGYSGWAAGQLEGELEVGGWLTSRATSKDVFADHESIWNQVAGRIGLEILSPALRRDSVPDDPSLN